MSANTHTHTHMLDGSMVVVDPPGPDELAWRDEVLRGEEEWRSVSRLPAAQPARPSGATPSFADSVAKPSKGFEAIDPPGVESLVRQAAERGEPLSKRETDLLHGWAQRHMDAVVPRGRGVEGGEESSEVESLFFRRRWRPVCRHFGCQRPVAASRFRRSDLDSYYCGGLHAQEALERASGGRPTQSGPPTPGHAHLEVKLVEQPSGWVTSRAAVIQTELVDALVGLDRFSGPSEPLPNLANLKSKDMKTVYEDMLRAGLGGYKTQLNPAECKCLMFLRDKATSSEQGQVKTQGGASVARPERVFLYRRLASSIAAHRHPDGAAEWPVEATAATLARMQGVAYRPSGVAIAFDATPGVRPPLEEVATEEAALQARELLAMAGRCSPAPTAEPSCEQCEEPMRKVGELIQCNYLCRKMLCENCFPPPCHRPCCGTKPVQPKPEPGLLVPSVGSVTDSTLEEAIGDMTILDDLDPEPTPGGAPAGAAGIQAPAGATAPVSRPPLGLSSWPEPWPEDEDDDPPDPPPADDTPEWLKAAAVAQAAARAAAPEWLKAASAAQAAAPSPSSQTLVTRVASGDGATQVCRSDGISCRGCGKPIRLGSKMVVCLTGFAHSATCRSVAIAHSTRPSPRLGTGSAMPTAGSLQKQTQLRERFSPVRMMKLRQCMCGRCGFVGTDEPVMTCKSCGLCKLHVRCAQIARGNALKANFKCVDCRLSAMQAEGSPSAALLDEITHTCLLELTLLRETTAAGHQAFVTLAEKWVAEKKQQGLTRVLSPTANRESFAQFAVWMVLTADRARSLTTTMRAAGGYFEGTGSTNFTKDPAMKKALKELEDLHGTDSNPMTHGTRRMLSLTLNTILPKKYAKKRLLWVREAVNLINESVGCLRATESCMAVEGHGLEANSCFILTDLATGEVSVEVKVRDSKTKLSRWVNMAGETAVSKVQVAKAYKDLFFTNGLSTVRGREGGFEFIQPDSWSVKLSLLAMPADFTTRLERVLEQTMPQQGKKINERLVQYARDAEKATSKGESHKYVLLSEGPMDSLVHGRLMQALQHAGLGEINEGINLVAAPLLRSTHCTGTILMPMPYTYKAADDIAKQCFEESFKLANPPGDPDPEFDLQGHPTPRWGQHSWRRFGDKVARDSQEIHMMSETEVDLFAGWDLYEHSLDMQIHYAGQQRSHRVKRREITRQI